MCKSGAVFPLPPLLRLHCANGHRGTPVRGPQEAMPGEASAPFTLSVG